MGLTLVSVAVPAPLYTAFDYRVEPGQQPAPGMRVRVPFGRRQAVGVVLGRPRTAEGHDRTYRPLGAILDPEPLLPAPVLALCEWAAAYYHHPIGQAVATALPAALRAGGAGAARREPLLRLTAEGATARGGLPARATALRALLDGLSAGPRPRHELAGVSAAALRRARDRGWVDEQPAPEAPEPADAAEAPPRLSQEQAQALDILRGGAGFRVALLEGVTGSGKTELYLQRAGDVLAGGRQVLVLVPEIGLTPQLSARFSRRFGAAVASFHSGLPDGERAAVWLRARSGRARIVVGTRSAAFLPFPDLGLVIVDEEHDPSFKQQEGLRYSARDLAIVRARAAGIPVVLGSATPALETLHNARAGRYAHARLQRRIHRAAPPEIRLLDVRGQRLTHGLSPVLMQATARHLEAGGQVLLFINRRGYAPVLLCHDCGWQAPCGQCDARLTLHRARGRLICHHCGAQQAIPAGCGACGSKSLVPVGQGTERIEDALREAFPGQRTERFDSDRIRRRGELERLLEDIRSGAIRILVGTQMLAKGHDFAGLSLVGILHVDQALYGADFRALERMGQLVTQVSGRAGRADRAGEVILQTHEPHHPALQQLLHGGYPALCEALLGQRRSGGLPPFSHLALLRAEGPRPAPAMRFLEEARAALRPARGLGVLGPVPAPMERLGGRHRAQLLLQATRRPVLQQALAAWVPALDALPAARGVRWSVDVDPLDLF